MRLLRRSVLPDASYGLLLATAGLSWLAPAHPASAAEKHVLIVYEPGPTVRESGFGDARQLQQLLGHFPETAEIVSAERYQAGTAERYDALFYLGFSHSYVAPGALVADARASRRAVVWVNQAVGQLGGAGDNAAWLGFVVERADTSSGFDAVEASGRRYRRAERELLVARVTDATRCQVVATAHASRRDLTVPYIVRSGRFSWVADSPFSYVGASDRYLLFADLLHDVLEEDHAREHLALIRIEDTSPFSDPSSLRAVADALFEARVPFLVGVTPIYVNPAGGVRVPMSVKPDYVDALKYMVARGGTVVMHGATHQVTGETASDFEFWDASRAGPLPTDAPEEVRRRLREGVMECMRNGIYPLLWETPHYAASNADYAEIARFFSSATEQRFVDEQVGFSQQFPFVIRRDVYGQTILPENLGYVPGEVSPEAQQAAVDRMIEHARVALGVRDGVVGAFFHPFLDVRLLERLVDGLRGLGYRFADAREWSHTVRLGDRVIACGAGEISVRLRDQYLSETVLDQQGRVASQEFSRERLNGPIQRQTHLAPRAVFVAEPREYRPRALSKWERLRHAAREAARVALGRGETTRLTRVLALSDPQAAGGAANDQASLAAAFEALSVPVARWTVGAGAPLDLGSYNLVLVPYNVADALDDAQIEALRAFVERGGGLITDFRNPVAEELGVRFFESQITVEHLSDALDPEQGIRFPSSEAMTRFDTHDDDVVFATDAESGIPVVVGRRLGRGAFVFFGTRFDPSSSGGYARFPHIAHYAQRLMGLVPPLQRQALEVYFDPGLRAGVNIEQLVPRWAQLGVRVVYVGGWHEYPKYSYDYARLVRLCHAYGILAYAWIEPPQVTQQTWLDNAECRERNFKNENVRPSWRYPIALTEPRCLELALEQYGRLLRSFDWDGINIAELHFEGGRGFEEPEQLTPFHASAREAFTARHGFDPRALLDPASPRFWRRDPASAALFTSFRVESSLALLHRLLGLGAALQRERLGFEVVVTALDSLSAPELTDQLGIDTPRIAALGAGHDFTLQVEDPASMWSLDPRRYEAIGGRYASLVDGARLALDVNVLPVRPATSLGAFPTRTQTGTELYWLVQSAARGARRVAVYSEATVRPHDLPLLAAALAAGARVDWVADGFDLEAPFAVRIELPTEPGGVVVDAEPAWPSAGGGLLVPAGRHKIRFAAPPLAMLRSRPRPAELMSITGELRALQVSARSVRFAYASAGRCLARLSREPLAVFIDGRESLPEVLRAGGGLSLRLPPGDHDVLVVVEDRMSYGIDLTSLWSSQAIVAFGVLSAGLLLGLYAFVRTRRLVRGRAR